MYLKAPKLDRDNACGVFLCFVILFKKQRKKSVYLIPNHNRGLFMYGFLIMSLMFIHTTWSKRIEVYSSHIHSIMGTH